MHVPKEHNCPARVVERASGRDVDDCCGVRCDAVSLGGASTVIPRLTSDPANEFFG